MLSCTGAVTNLSGKGQQYRGALCGISIPCDGFVLVPAFYNVSASGEANLKCTYTKP